MLEEGQSCKFNVSYAPLYLSGVSSKVSSEFRPKKGEIFDNLFARHPVFTASGDSQSRLFLCGLQEDGREGRVEQVGPVRLQRAYQIRLVALHAVGHSRAPEIDQGAQQVSLTDRF